MHQPVQLFLDLLDLRRHAVTSGLPMNQEVPPAGIAADENKTQEIKGLWFTDPALFSLSRRVAVELNPSGPFRMQPQRKLLQPFAHRVPEASGVGLLLEADDDVARLLATAHTQPGQSMVAHRRHFTVTELPYA